MLRTTALPLRHPLPPDNDPDEKPKTRPRTTVRQDRCVRALYLLWAAYIVASARRWCGGELFVAVPGVGMMHVPGLQALRVFSMALPVTLAMYSMAWTIAVLLHWRGWKWAAVVVALIGVPFLVRGPFGYYLVQHLSAQPTLFGDPVREQGFAASLRDGRHRHRQLTVLGDDKYMRGRLDVETVRRRSWRWIDSRRDEWSLHPASTGAPHFSFGFRYNQGWRGGVFEKDGTSPAEARLMWSELGFLYESLRAELERTVGHSVLLHHEINPPASLVNLPFATNKDGRYTAEVHQDKVTYDFWTGEEGKVCRPNDQMTLTLTIKAPVYGPTGVQFWRYRNDAGPEGCGNEGRADFSCVEHRFVPYEEGGFVVFPSLASHATGHASYQPIFGFDERVILVAFLVPCGDAQSGEVWHLLPTIPVLRGGVEEDGNP